MVVVEEWMKMMDETDKDECLIGYRTEGVVGAG